VVTLSANQAAVSASTESNTTAGSKKSRISRKFSFAVCLLVLLAMCIFWLVTNYNTQNLLRQQADRLGQTLAQQTAIQLTELVLANDLISMNVVLNNLTRNSSIAEVRVLNVSNEVIATSTGTPLAENPIIPLPFTLTRMQAQYQSPINLADSIAGFVQVRLDLSYIETTLVNNLLFVVAATILLMVIALTLVTTYMQYMVSFPANLLAFAISNIRKGEIETCPEPDNNSELSAAIRQYNATAEFLAQNTFLDNFGRRRPMSDSQVAKFVPGTQDSTLLCVQLANFHYLSSTQNETLMVNLLNKFNFLMGKVSQLYNGTVSYCAEGELVINFSDAQLEEEQAFYAICAGQLMLQLLGDLADVNGEHIPIKLKIAVHSGPMVSGLYSAITQDTTNITGRTLDFTREICVGCPDNCLLLSATAYNHAGAGTRVDAEVFTELDDNGHPVTIYLTQEPMSEYGLLLERQAIQLVTLYAD